MRTADAVVMELANTQVTILRGTITTPLGDVIDSDAPYLEHVPACLVETGRQTQDPSTPSPRTIRQVKCTVPAWCEALTTDRILDERTQDVYMVITVYRPPDIFGPPPGLVLSLKRVTAAGA